MLPLLSQFLMHTAVPHMINAILNSARTAAEGGVGDADAEAAGRPPFCIPPKLHSAWQVAACLVSKGGVLAEQTSNVCRGRARSFIAHDED